MTLVGFKQLLFPLSSVSVREITGFFITEMCSRFMKEVMTLPLMQILRDSRKAGEDREP